MRRIDADALQEKLTKKKPGPANARYTEGFNDALLRFKSMIHAAPTIEPERKKGKWIDETFKPWGLVHHPYKCDQCGEHSEADSDFCPSCGADMREDTDDQSK